MTKNSLWALKTLILAVVCMWVLTILPSIAITHTVSLGEWLAGWAMTTVNVILAVCIYEFAFTRRGNAILVWAVGANGVRAVCMLCAVIAIGKFAIQHPLPYVIAVLSGTLCMMTAEVYYLYRRLNETR